MTVERVSTKTSVDPLPCYNYRVNKQRHSMQARPEVLLSRADYLEDVKVRWQIHLYEVEKLQEDLTAMRKMISEKVSQFSDLMYYTWADM